MTLTQLLDVLLARWKLLLVSACLCAAMGYGVSSMLPKRYTAIATVIVDVRGIDVIGNLSAERTSAATQGMVTNQADLIGSERVARRVVTEMQLDKDPARQRAWVEDTGGTGDIVAYLARSLLKGLEVRPGRESNIVSLYYTAADPVVAQTTVNRFAQVSIATNLDLKVDPATLATTWFDERNKTLRDRLNKAQAALGAYQHDKGLVTRADGGMDTENAKLQQLTLQLLDAQQSRLDVSSRYAHAVQSPYSSPEILNNNAIAVLRSNLGNAQADLSMMQSRYRDPYPQLKTARDEVALLQGRLDNEVTAVINTLRTAQAIASQREASAQNALDAQKARVLSLMSDVSDSSTLRSEVDSAQRALDAAMARQSQTALESKIQQGNLGVLSLADEPVTPSGPRIKLNAIMAALGGLLLGIGIALWLETRRPIIRRLEDLRMPDFEILAVLPRVRFGRGRPARRQLTHGSASA